MKKQIKAIVAAILLTINFHALAHAVPLTTMLQGFLTTPDGNPYNSPQTVRLKVYQAGKPGTAGSGTLVYDETATITPTASGVFNYLLGSGTPNGDTLMVNGEPQANVLSTATYDTAQSIYVELSIGGATLLPRLQLTGVPYAVISTIAENLKPGSQIKTTGLVASWVTINSTDTAQASLQTSSSVVVQNGGVIAPYFNGKFIGDGSGITGVSASQVAAANVQSGNLNPLVVVSSLAVNAVSSDSQIAPGANISQGKILNLTSDLSNRLLKTGDTMTGPLTLNNSSLTLSGPAGNIVTQGSVTAGAFIGDGSGLTGVSASQVSASNVTAGTLPPTVLVPASNITSGPIAPALLPNSVAYTSTANNFTAAQTISAAEGLTVNSAVNAGIVTVTGAATASPAANTITKENITKGWVNFDGSPASCPNVGNQCAIRASFNVASVTRAAPGSYTITWKTPFSDANYVPTGGCQRMDSTAAIMFQIGRGATGYPFTTTTALIGCANYDGYPIDASVIAVQAMGNQ